MQNTCRLLLRQAMNLLKEVLQIVGIDSRRNTYETGC